MAKERRGQGPMAKRSAAESKTEVTAAEVKEAARRALTVLGDGPDRSQTALSAAWPDPVLELSPKERDARVRKGADTVILDDTDPDTGRRRGARGFVRVVLRVPIGHPDAQVYGVFVEVDKAGYQQLRAAYDGRGPADVWGTLATRLPLLEDAYGSKICVREEGGDKRPVVVDAEHPLLRSGPEIGPPQGE